MREGRNENIGIGAIILLLAAAVAGFAVWRWRTGRTPLTVERSGRVCYGEKELCAAGEVQVVRLVEAPGGEHAYDVHLGLNGETWKLVPGFAYGHRQNALAFAKELAAALRVPVEEAA